MGNLALKAVSKTGTDALRPSAFKSLKDIPVNSLLGGTDPAKTIGEISGDNAQAYLCVNVASK